MNGLIYEMKRVVCEVIGNEQQAIDVVFALIKNFGGERLHIPSNDYEKRNREIYELHNAGATVEQLARRYQLSAKTIYRILGAKHEH